ncbi:MAG: hypothetical protein WC869_01185 [Phycisphaerae bacterium]|jgi:hypothetical protein
MKITLQMQTKAVATVITMLDGNSMVGKAKVDAYPAIKFPGMEPVILIGKNQTDPKPAKNYAAAEKIAAKSVRSIVAKAKLAIAKAKAEEAASYGRAKIAFAKAKVAKKAKKK